MLKKLRIKFGLGTGTIPGVDPDKVSMFGMIENDDEAKIKGDALLELIEEHCPLKVLLKKTRTRLNVTWVFQVTAGKEYFNVFCHIYGIVGSKKPIIEIFLTLDDKFANKYGISNKQIYHKSRRLDKTENDKWSKRNTSKEVFELYRPLISESYNNFQNTISSLLPDFF